MSRITFFSGYLFDYDFDATSLGSLYPLQQIQGAVCGVTNNLTARLRQHKDCTYSGFAEHYKVDRLVYHEAFAWVQDAIAREKQIKRWRGRKRFF